LSSKKNILIVCFSFPPFPGIGGRRWAKFARHLANANFNVHVLAAENSSANISEWNEDVHNGNIKVTSLPLGNSRVFSFYPSNLWEKLIYKALSIKASLFIKGNKQDKIFFIKDKLLKAAEKLVNENKIDTLIVTLPPYKLSYYLLPLKKKYPHLKFIVDYRDPWTDNRSYHGFATISKEDLAAEIEFEKEVLNTADVVLDVNEQSLIALKNKTGSKALFKHLPNGFDQNDYRSIDLSGSLKGDKDIHFVYSGSFYPNLIYLLKPVISVLNKLKTTNTELYKKLHFDFYGNMDHEAIELLKHSDCDAIRFHGSIPQKEVLNKINQADFCLLFAATDHANAFNTKFYEYLYFKKPILYFGGKGDASGFIINNRIGSLFESHQIETLFFDFLNSRELTEFSINSSVDISSFDIENISKTLIGIINA
jgi:hypothetical protein